MSHIPQNLTKIEFEWYINIAREKPGFNNPIKEKKMPFKKIIFTALISKIVSTDNEEGYSICEATLTTGQEVLILVHETNLDLKTSDGITGTGSFVTGVTDFFGMSKKTQLLYVSEWNTYEAWDDWKTKSAA